jgi:predicted RNA-binding Zn-ribbon protein involved in translation (DUF1610 family)
MALSQEQKDKISEWRRSKGIENCIACGFSEEMNYGDIVALPILGGSRGQTVIAGAGGQTVISSGQTVISGSGGRVVIDGEEVVGPVGGIVPVACPNCGYTMLFSKEVLAL